jgi:hypothetical protein
MNVLAGKSRARAIRSEEAMGPMVSKSVIGLKSTFLCNGIAVAVPSCDRTAGRRAQPRARAAPMLPEAPPTFRRSSA